MQCRICTFFCFVCVDRGIAPRVWLYNMHNCTYTYGFFVSSEKAQSKYADLVTHKNEPLAKQADVSVQVFVAKVKTMGLIFVWPHKNILTLSLHIIMLSP